MLPVQLDLLTFILPAKGLYNIQVAGSAEGGAD